MRLDDVMDEVAVRLSAIAGLRVFAYPPATVTPPAAVVTFPESISYDLTYGRGYDTMILPVLVVVGRPTDRSCRDAVAGYVEGDGPTSVKVALEAEPFDGAYSSCRVTEVTFDVGTIGGTEYLIATFMIEIAGPGSAA